MKFLLIVFFYFYNNTEVKVIATYDSCKVCQKDGEALVERLMPTDENYCGMETLNAMRFSCVKISTSAKLPSNVEDH